MNIYRAGMDNKEMLEKYLAYNNYPGCELSVANNILWSDFYDTSYTIIEDMLVFCRLQGGTPVNFSFPVGKHDPRNAFDAIVKYFEENNIEFNMYLVGPQMFELINSWYPDMYQIKYNRDDADYLYLSETLSGLKGKKLHGKRNHINNFLKNYPNYEYEVINDHTITECVDFAEQWERENNPEGERDKVYELQALKNALHNYRELGLLGALIRVEGNIVAFTLGERLTEDTFVVHFEKARADIQGAYPMINREFVIRELMSYKYINREEDMGIPGLRHAKTSYQPIKLLEKGLVTKKKALAH